MTGVYTNTRLEILSSQSKVSNTHLTIDTHTHIHRAAWILLNSRHLVIKKPSIYFSEALTTSHGYTVWLNSFRVAKGAQQN